MGETDPREETVAKIIWSHFVAEPWEGRDNFNRVPYRDAADAILAALDAARPAEPLQEYDATDAIDRAIRNWSTISDEPPADEEVAGLVERLRDPLMVYQQGYDPILATDENVEDMKAAAALIERLSAEVARLTAERDEARSLHNACAEARDSAGYLGTVVYCIEDLHTRATAAEAEGADLREKLAQAVEALEPFAEQAEGIDGWHDDASVDAQVTAGDLRRARAALASKEPAP